MTCRVFLADLANTYYGVSPATIPVASGYLAAFLQKQYGSQLDIRIFRTVAPLLDAVRTDPPDILGCSVYAWNQRLAVWASEKVKAISPGTVIVHGGPSIELTDASNAAYLTRNSATDFLAWYEGEAALANLVAAYLEHGGLPGMKRQAIPGVCFLDGGQLVAGARLQALAPLEESVPSPYLTGLFDSLLKDPALMPLIQTTRGCPYSCTFCVSGQPVYNKLRSFGTDRVKEEIRYLHRHAANRGIRFTDDNFGLFERDVEIAGFIREMYDTHRYPIGLKIYYGKLLSERIKECALILKPLLPLCMSFQSLTPAVLQEVKRPNNTEEKFDEARRWARKHDVAVATELIYGLPYETYDSFVDSLDRVVRLRVDSVFPHSVWLFDGAELATAESRERYGFRTRFRIGPDGVTRVGQEISVEQEEYAVESKWMTEADFERLTRLGLFSYWFLGYGFFKEILYHGVTHGLTLSGLFAEVTDNPARYPVTSGLLSSYGKEMRASFFETREQLEAHVAASLESSVPLEVTRLETVYVGRMVARKAEVLAELRDLVLQVARDAGVAVDQEFRDITEMLCAMSGHLLVELGAGIADVVEWPTRWDLVQWARDDYQRPLAAYALPVPAGLHLVMNNIVQTRATNAAVAQLDEKSKMQYYLRNTNSTNVRRRVAYALEPAAPGNVHLLNLEGFADAAQSVRPEDFLS